MSGFAWCVLLSVLMGACFHAWCGPPQSFHACFAVSARYDAISSKPPQLWASRHPPPTPRTPLPRRGTLPHPAAACAPSHARWSAA